jgi:surface antigen
MIHSHRLLAPLLVAALALGATAPIATAAATPAAAHVAKSKAKHKKHKKKVHGRHGTLKGKVKHSTPAGPAAGGKGAGTGDDYPAKWKNAPQDSLLDDWREYNRECTSFAAWALSSRNGYDMKFFDDAKNWGPRAKAIGVPVDTNPAVGSIAWSSTGKYGHVAYVSAVDGGNVYVEQYNKNLKGTYSAGWVPASQFTGFIHFKDLTPTAPTAPPTPDPGTTQPPPPPTHVLTIDNRVTDGAGMREDTPAYLSTQTKPYCKRDGCAVPNTDRISGQTYESAVCTVIGQRITNGQDNSAVDDGNPELYTSSRWYGVRLADGTTGFISEVFVRATDRGGLGLPAC